MLLVRIGSRGRWSATEPSIERAVKDLGLRPDEIGLSVYRVDSLDTAKNVAKLFAPTARQNVGRIDFVLFDENIVSAVDGLELRKTGCALHPDLSDMHLEIIGLDPEKSKQLATAILASSFSVERISENELIESVRAKMSNDEDFRNYVYEDWLDRAISQ
jgi:hypothetical protein